MALKKSENTVADAVDNKADEVKTLAGFCIYIGPSITGCIQQNTIYPGSVPDAVASDAVQLAVRKYPRLAELFVDGNAIHEAVAEVKTKGTVRYNAYHHATEK